MADEGLRPATELVEARTCGTSKDDFYVLSFLLHCLIVLVSLPEFRGNFSLLRLHQVEQS